MFSKFIQWQIQQEMCNKSTTERLITRQDYLPCDTQSVVDYDNGMSKQDYISLIFIDCVVKVDEQYY